MGSTKIPGVTLMSHGVTVQLLRDVLPVGTTLDAETVRSHLHRVATRMEGTLGEERTSWTEDCLVDPARLPLPEGPIVVGIDGGQAIVDERGIDVAAFKSIPMYRIHGAD